MSLDLVLPRARPNNTNEPDGHDHQHVVDKFPDEFFKIRPRGQKRGFETALALDLQGA